MVICVIITLLITRKKSTKIKFLGAETARWGGGLPREGVVAENFVPALETLSSLGFEERNPGCPGNFAGMSRTPGGVRKVCAKKLRAHFSFPNQTRHLPFLGILISLDCDPDCLANLPILGHFSLMSPVGPKSVFSAIFSDFAPEARAFRSRVRSWGFSNEVLQV